MWIYNKKENVLGCAVYSNEKGAYITYTPKGMLSGRYKVFFWNIRYFNTNPVQLVAQILTGGKKLRIENLSSNLTTPRRSGRWEALGVFDFTGAAGEGVCLFATGKKYARAADVRFVPLEKGKPTVHIGLTDAQCVWHGTWCASFFSDSNGFGGFHLQNMQLGPEKTLSLFGGNYYQFIFVKQGRMDCTFDGKKMHLPLGTLVAVKPKTAIWFENCENNPCYFTLFCIFPDLFRQAAERVNCWEEIKSGNMQNPILLNENLARSLALRMSAYPKETPHRDRSQLFSLCMLLLEELLVYMNGEKKKEYQPAPIWLQQAREKMLEATHLKEGVKALIRLSAKTQEHVTRCMGKYYGETPSQYVNRVRLKYAAKLLLETECSVLDAAFDSGFQNVSYFYTVFRDFYGITPGAYRKQQNFADL